VADRLAELSWPQVGQRTDAVLAIPVGSTEQHGPHLPLSTDTDIAVALCERLAAARHDVLVAPAIAYGSAGEHAGFPGTLSIGQAALELVLLELVRSATDTFDHVLLVSAHGGNAEPVTRAVRRLRGESRDVHVFAPTWTGDPHAGRPETSMLLSLAPQQVRLSEAVVGDTRPLPELLPLLRAGGVRAVSSSGVLGDPTGATAAEGEILLTRLADALTEVVATWIGSRS
jgi:creatinine amidohydrolase